VSHTPETYGMKLCAVCKTWVLEVAPLFVNGDYKLDEHGQPILACKNVKYCGLGASHMQTLAGER